MSIGQSNVNDVIGTDVYGSDGDKIGQVGQVFLDDVTGRPEWVTVMTGLFGTKQSFIPVAQSQFSGDELRVPYDKDVVKDAPRVDVEKGHLSREEEAELHRHYGLDYFEQDSDSGLPDGPDRDEAMAGPDISEEEHEVVLHEERPVVEKEAVPVERVKLDKETVTDQEQVTETVRKEQIETDGVEGLDPSSNSGRR